MSDDRDWHSWDSPKSRLYQDNPQERQSKIEQAICKWNFVIGILLIVGYFILLAATFGITPPQ